MSLSMSLVKVMSSELQDHIGIKTKKFSDPERHFNNKLHLTDLFSPTISESMDTIGVALLTSIKIWKFGLNPSICFQEIEQKLNYAGMAEKQRETGQIQNSPTFSKRGYKYDNTSVSLQGRQE